MANKRRKQRFAQAKSKAGRLAQALSLSLYPKHLNVLVERAKELNAPKSILMQLLLDLESQNGLLAPEIEKRVNAALLRSAAADNQG